MALTGKNNGAICRLLTSAFSAQELIREADYILPGIRAHIADGSLAQVAYDIVRLTDARGELPTLLAGLRAVRPGRAVEFNAVLRDAFDIAPKVPSPAAPVPTPTPAAPVPTSAKAYNVAHATLEDYNAFMQWVTDPLGNGRSLFWFLHIAQSRVDTAHAGIDEAISDLKVEIERRRRRDPLAPNDAAQVNALRKVQGCAPALTALVTSVRGTRPWEQIQRDLGHTSAEVGKTTFTRENSPTLSAEKVVALVDLHKLLYAYAHHLEDAYGAIVGVVTTAAWDSERSRKVALVFHDARERCERLICNIRAVAQAKEDEFADWD